MTLARHILVPTDFSEAAAPALAAAASLARTQGARVTLLHVLDVAPFALGHVGLRPTQPRRPLRVRLALGERETEAVIRPRQLGVAPVDLVAGEACTAAKVLTPAQTVFARAAGPAQPRHADPVAHREAGRRRARGHDPADDLVSGHPRKHRGGKLGVDDVEIGAADAARRHADQDVAVADLWRIHLVEPQRLAGLEEPHRPHVDSAAPREHGTIVSGTRV